MFLERQMFVIPIVFDHWIGQSFRNPDCLWELPPMFLQKQMFVIPTVFDHWIPQSFSIM